MRNYLLADEYLNDSALTGFRVEDRRLELEFRDMDGVRHRLTVADVYAATPFGLGLRNTVEGIYSETLTAETIGATLQEMKALSGGRQMLGDPQKMSDYILNKGLGLLVVEPSEGGGVLAICDLATVEVSRIG